MIQSDGKDILVSTIVGKMWHIPGPFRGRTLCGFQISSVELPDSAPHCRKCVRSEIQRLRRIHGRPGMLASEFAEYLPEHLRQPYWRSKIEEFFDQVEQELDADV